MGAYRPVFLKPSTVMDVNRGSTPLAPSIINLAPYWPALRTLRRITEVLRKVEMWVRIPSGPLGRNKDGQTNNVRSFSTLAT